MTRFNRLVHPRALNAKVRSLREGHVSKELIRDAAKPPDVALERLQGGKTNLAALRGKNVVMVFWGLWCAASKAAMPELKRTYDRLRDSSGVAFVTINNDPNPEEVRNFVRVNNYTFDILIDDGYAAKVGIETFPRVWILDKKGRKVFELEGYSAEASLAEDIETRVALLSKQLDD